MLRAASSWTLTVLVETVISLACMCSHNTDTPLKLWFPLDLIDCAKEVYDDVVDIFPGKQYKLAWWSTVAIATRYTVADARRMVR